MITIPWRKPLLIGLIGPAQAGKDTVASILKEDYGIAQTSFAGPMYKMLSVMTGLRVEKLQQYKNVPLARLAENTPRHALQTLGTEWGRNMIDRNIWPIAWENNVNEFVASGSSIAISDVRFPNEHRHLQYWAVKHDYQYSLICITREKAEVHHTHSSEDYWRTVLSQRLYTYRIKNDLDINSLETKVYGLIGCEKERQGIGPS